MAAPSDVCDDGANDAIVIMGGGKIKCHNQTAMLAKSSEPPAPALSSQFSQIEPG
jgi:hypothetical protein